MDHSIPYAFDGCIRYPRKIKYFVKGTKKQKVKYDYAGQRTADDFAAFMKDPHPPNSNPKPAVGGSSTSTPGIEQFMKPVTQGGKPKAAELPAFMRQPTGSQKAKPKLEDFMKVVPTDSKDVLKPKPAD